MRFPLDSWRADQEKGNPLTFLVNGWGIRRCHNRGLRSNAGTSIAAALPQNGRRVVLGRAATGTNDIGWLSCPTITASRPAGEGQVSWAKARVILGDTISISAHRKVRPGGARRLRHPRHARLAGRRALAITAGKAARSTVRRLGRGNGTAAGAAACQLPAGALSAVESVTTGFFRTERVTSGGREVHLALAENPNGYTEVLRALLGDGQPRHMLLGLNDPASNQQPDVSWIWDVDFESLRGLVPAAVLSGNRATDLAVRLKYAGWLGPEAGIDATDIVVEHDPLRALQLALERTPSDQPVWVVSTYLVLWRLRSWLRRQGYVGALRER
jgi:hypothetical protein